VWDISTARCCKVLPFDRYGHLLQIETTSDASRLALLFQAVDDARYVALTDLLLGGEARDPLYADHSRCTSFVVLPDWHWMATRCSERAEFKMWYAGPKDSHVMICPMAKDAATFSEAACSPTFTFDSLFTVHVNRRDRTLVVYGLRQMAPRWRSPALTALGGQVSFKVQSPRSSSPSRPRHGHVQSE
jgi:hypothetical protein